MAKGNRGGKIAALSHSVFTNEKPIELENERHRSSGLQWRNTILSATKGEKDGHIVLGYATPTRYENPNKNTTVAHYKLDHGIWDGQVGDRSTRSHGINWDNVNRVSGKTFDVRDLLKENGFKFDGKTKDWVKE